MSNRPTPDPRPEQEPSAACLCCGSAEVGRPIRKGGYTYRTCAGCGHGQLDPLPGADEAAGLYGEDYFRGDKPGAYPDYAADEHLHRRNAAARLRALHGAGCRPPGTLLDVGCALGFFLDEARREGWDGAGVDVSPWVRERAAERFRIETFAALDLAAASRPGGFDAVTFFQVLEHMPRPDRALEAAHRCLRPGGTLAIETWDRSSRVARIMGTHWQQICPPSVVHLFSRRSLAALLERNGFERWSIRRSSKFVSAGFVAAILRREFPRAGKWPLALPERPWLRDTAVRYRFGDLITIAARRALV